MIRPEWFAGRLRELREARGWTQHQLAGAAGVTAAAVKCIEQGRNRPVWDTVVALCRALAVRPDAFAQAPACRPRPRGRPCKAGPART
jgi:transcriptional regulator with XRE-family HTH domain